MPESPSTVVPDYIAFAIVIGTVYMTLHPLSVNLYLNEDLSCIRWWEVKYTEKRKAAETVDNKVKIGRHTNK